MHVGQMLIFIVRSVHPTALLTAEVIKANVSIWMEVIIA